MKSTNDQSDSTNFKYPWEEEDEGKEPDPFIMELVAQIEQDMEAHPEKREAFIYYAQHGHWEEDKPRVDALIAQGYPREQAVGMVELENRLAAGEEPGVDFDPDDYTW